MTGLQDLRFETGAATHVGKVRAQNEDNLLTRPEIGLWCVADGMGGHEAGGLASAAIVEALRHVRPPATAAGLLAASRQSLVDANAAIRAIAKARGFALVGATVVVLLASGRHFACLWAGDSRLYRIRAGAAAQLTRDHSEVQDMVDKGLLSDDEARTWPGRNVITRAIGASPAPDLDMLQGDIEPGDVFLLCSDGLTTHVADDEIAARATARAPQDACAALVDLTLERGGADNVTVVIVRSSAVERTIVAAGQPRPAPRDRS
ncbi:PP2C family protein-serine/threonine phosphatase [Alsobacter sp. SYSU BS001988]|jgi:serine/threonine protein phosphatase PrpC